MKCKLCNGEVREGQSACGDCRYAARYLLENVPDHLMREGDAIVTCVSDVQAYLSMESGRDVPLSVAVVVFVMQLRLRKHLSN